MSLVLLANACSHLQNASAARLGLTSLPTTNMLHTLLLSLQKSGYVSNVTIGGPTPPPPSALSPVFSASPIDAYPSSSLSTHFEDAAPDLASTSSTTTTKLAAAAAGSANVRASHPLVTQSNVATRRLWIGLKYYRNEPVLHKMRVVSKPTRRVWMNVEQLEKLCLGVSNEYVRGMRGIGESLYVSTDRGIMEIRECVERRIGGMLLCRINPAY